MDQLTQKRLLRREDVEQVTGLRRSSLYERVAGGSFPAPVKIGKRAVRWRYGDILEWIENLETAESETARLEARLPRGGVRRMKGGDS